MTAKLYKRDDFGFPIVNFPFIYGNIPAAPAYGIYIYLIWYANPGIVLPIRILMIEGYSWQVSYWAKGFSEKN